ncbi:hypothetical protein BHE74_00046967 [Ensete ventricosum]|nr:hypothetical protein BHE74_00046967 [Ensete ventricosum]
MAKQSEGHACGPPPRRTRKWPTRVKWRAPYHEHQREACSLVGVSPPHCVLTKIPCYLVIRHEAEAPSLESAAELCSSIRVIRLKSQLGAPPITIARSHQAPGFSPWTLYHLYQLDNKLDDALGPRSIISSGGGHVSV